MIGGATVRPRDAGRARCAFVLVAGARLGRQVGTDAYSCAPTRLPLPLPPPPTPPPPPPPTPTPRSYTQL
ncbi:PAS domain-containing sensor histidine kinase, partial [Burkholderia pseudomallei]